MTASRKKRLGELLLEAGVVDATQLQAALGHQRQWGIRLGQALVDMKLASEADIVQALAKKFGFDVARLDALEPYAFEQALKLVPREFAVRNNVFPMQADTGSITVAMSDPTNLAVVDELRFRTGRKVKVCIGGDREVAAALQDAYPNEHGVQAIALDLDLDDAHGEPVLDPFGGGSKDALEAFFGNGPDSRVGQSPPPAPGPAAAAAAVVPPTPRQAPAPRASPARAAPPAPPAPPAAAARVAALAPPAAAPARPAPATTPASRPAASRPATAAPRAAPVLGTYGPAPVAAAPAGSTAAARSAEPEPPVPPAADVELEAPDVVSARAALLGVVPHGGFADEAGAHEELIPLEDAHAPVPGAPILATELAPDDEMVEGRYPTRPLTARELAILDALDRLAGGAHAEPEIVKPAQAMAALIRLLIRRKIVTEEEFLDELQRK